MKEKAKPLDKASLIEHLRTQLDVIRDHCASYDVGKVHYAHEIAVKLRVIFHNTNSNKSLLRQLKLEGIQFVDTGTKYEPNNILAHNGLINMETSLGVGKDGSWKWVPKLDKDKRLVNLDNWWNSKKIIAEGKKPASPQKESDQNKKIISFTRKDLILEVADTDGGAHVDSSIKTDYHELRNNNLMGWFYGEGIPLQNPVPPTIRQIGYEVLCTFDQIDITGESKLR